MDLGRLVQLNSLREIWPNESGDFTPWLAREENLALLGETIGLELKFETRECGVGPFRADILCKDVTSDNYVLIENQLEKTDHTHLGQLITYAAGLDAVTIVWIADRFLEEHRSALNWLNRNTSEGINFFGIVIEVWKIGDSKPAPRFHIVCQPDEWAKAVKRSAEKHDASELSDYAQRQFTYWSRFNENMQNCSIRFTLDSPQPRSYSRLACGFGIAYFSANVDKDGVPSATLMTRDNELFQFLESKRVEIEQSFGGSLNWDYRDSRKQNYVWISGPSFDWNSPDSWTASQEWLKANLIRMHTAVHSQIQAYRIQ